VAIALRPLAPDSICNSAGIDYALPNSDFVLFGNAIIAFGAYKARARPGSFGCRVELE
jgi:hypothetical protein